MRNEQTYWRLTPGPMMQQRHEETIHIVIQPSSGSGVTSVARLCWEVETNQAKLLPTLLAPFVLPHANSMDVGGAMR